MKQTSIITFTLIWLLMAVSTGYSQCPVFKSIQKAIEQGRLGSVKLLLQQGADVNTKDEKGRTALMRVATQGRMDLVEFLVAKGADMNAKNKDGQTPLLLAMSNGHTDVAEFLRSRPAKE